MHPGSCTTSPHLWLKLDQQIGLFSCDSAFVSWHSARKVRIPSQGCRLSLSVWFSMSDCQAPSAKWCKAFKQWPNLPKHVCNVELNNVAAFWCSSPEASSFLRPWWSCCSSFLLSSEAACLSLCYWFCWPTTWVEIRFEHVFFACCTWPLRCFFSI